MDQNTPPDEQVSGQVPPAESDDGQGSTMGQQPPAASYDPQAAQPTAEPPGQGAAAEYAAWSTDVTYQNPDESGQPASQAPDASTAYAAPEPQAVTYQEQPPQDQSQGYEQQQQQQQAYDQQQQQYAQQQQAYDQQQQQYAQQQQPYDPQANPQQQPYDPQVNPQQQPYDPQQQGYYQQPPQGYQQQQYQQPAQPYAYAQPNQQGWPADQNYWEQESTGYGRSFMAVLAGFVLVTWGTISVAMGALAMWIGSFNDFIPEGSVFTAETQEFIDFLNREATGSGGVFVMIGILCIVGALGIWAHRGWGRAIGVVIGILGTAAGIAMLVSAILFEAIEAGLDQALKGELASLGISIVVLVSFLLVLLAMFVGRRHFRKKGVSAPVAPPA
jgi:hypothetical protein